MSNRAVVLAIAVGACAGWPTAAEAATQEQVATYVKDVVVPGLGVSWGEAGIWMTETALDPAHVARDLDPAVADLAFPFDLTWLVMVDTAPKANLQHLNYWVFVRDDLSEHLTLQKAYPPSVWLGATEKAFGCVTIPPVVYGCPEDPNFIGPPVAPPQEKDCLHAVLISGGIRPGANKARYRTNLISVYQTLRGLGYKKANIFVYYADGALGGDGSNPAFNGDLDGDGTSDITDAADETKIRAKISALCDDLDKEKDILFIYSTNHGAKDSGLNLWDTNGDAKADEIYTPAEFAADTSNCTVCRVYTVMDQCYSGQFTGLATDGSHKNMALYTAASAAEPSVCRQYIDFWEELDPSTTTLDKMHESVQTSMGNNTSTCTGGGNHCGVCTGAADCPGGSCDEDGSSTPQRAVGGADNGKFKLGECCENDFGDAPDNGQECPINPHDYKTTKENDGPRYNEWDFQWLGPNITGEEDGQPDCSAAFDFGDDGVGYLGFDPISGVHLIRVMVSVDLHDEPLDPAEPRDFRLDAWVDVPDDGTFHAGEHIIDSQVAYDQFSGGLFENLGTGTHIFDYYLFINPLDAYSRWRLSYDVAPATPVGPISRALATDLMARGEVEDYPPGGLGGNAFCPEDLNGDNMVNVNDFLLMLAAWGTPDPHADIDDDGEVNVIDFLLLLAAWGPCE
ncbi:MAG: GC-type dockerin domain-anchored protein [Planctomycetota bacterium]